MINYVFMYKFYYSWLNKILSDTAPIIITEYFNKKTSNISDNENIQKNIFDRNENPLIYPA